MEEALHELDQCQVSSREHTCSRKHLEKKHLEKQHLEMQHLEMQHLENKLGPVVNLPENVLVKLLAYSDK